MERILKQTQSDSVRVFVVWEPMLPTDWYRPTRPTLKRVSDTRAAQFWDKSHLIAAELKQQLQQFHGSHPRCCDDGDISGTWLPFISPASSGVKLRPLSMYGVHAGIPPSTVLFNHNT